MSPDLPQHNQLTAHSAPYFSGCLFWGTYFFFALVVFDRSLTLWICLTVAKPFCAKIPKNIIIDICEKINNPRQFNVNNNDNKIILAGQ